MYVYIYIYISISCRGIHLVDSVVLLRKPISLPVTSHLYPVLYRPLEVKNDHYKFFRGLQNNLCLIIDLLLQ